MRFASQGWVEAPQDVVDQSIAAYYAQPGKDSLPTAESEQCAASPLGVTLAPLGLAAAAQNIKRLVRFLSKAPSPGTAATA